MAHDALTDDEQAGGDPCRLITHVARSLIASTIGCTSENGRGLLAVGMSLRLYPVAWLQWSEYTLSQDLNNRTKLKTAYIML